MKRVAQLLNEMRDAGVITDYAIFGAVAQLRYTEPVATVDADVLVAVPDPDRLDVLSAIYQFCSAKGYIADGDAVRVGHWPVQFVPTFDEITRDALAKAESEAIEGVPLRVVGADYLALLALSVGRSKDYTRILALLESGGVGRDRLAELAGRYGLGEAWQRFEGKFLNE